MISSTTACFHGVKHKLRYTGSRLSRCRLCLLLSVLVLQIVSPLSAMRGAQVAANDADRHLLETGDYSKRRSANALGEIKFISYNIRYRGGDELRALIKELRTSRELGGAGVIGLQEVDRNRKRSGGENNARVIAEGLGMNYAWAAPPRTREDQAEDETGVALFSPYPLTDVERIVLPVAGPGGRRRVALGASLNVNNTKIRVYTVHAETRIPAAGKLEQQRRVLQSLASRGDVKHAVVLGDFNTIKPQTIRATTRLFTDAGFTTPFPADRPTWKIFILELKLDWIWLRGFKEVTGSGILNSLNFSDHWPLWVTVKLTN